MSTPDLARSIRPLSMQLGIITFTASLVAAELTFRVPWTHDHFLHSFLSACLVALTMLLVHAPLTRRVLQEKILRMTPQAGPMDYTDGVNKILSEISQGYIRLDRDWNVLHANANAAQTTNLPIPELINRKIWDVVPGFRETPFYQRYQQLWEQGGTVEFEDYLSAYSSWFKVKAHRRQDCLEVYFANTTAEHVAQDALSEAISREEILFGFNPHPMWIFDRETLRIVAVNHAALKTYGYTREEFLSLHIHALRPAEDIPLMYEKLRKLDAGQGFATQRRHLTKSGETIWIEGVGFPIQFERKNACLSIVQDITQRVEAEKAFRDNERRLRTIFEKAPVGIAEVDAHGCWLKVNQALCNFLGYTENELLGQPETTYVQNIDTRIEQQLLQQLHEGAIDEYQLTKQFLRKDGSSCWGELSRVAIRSEPDGRIRYTIALIRDVDEQYRARQVLVNAERQFRLVADSAPMLLWQSNARGEILYFNRAWRELLYRSDQLPANASWIDQIHPDERLLCERMFQYALQHHVPLEMDFRIQAHDGRYRWLSQVARPQFDEDGFTGYIGTCADITDRKLQEQKVQASESRLRSVTSSLPCLVFELVQHKTTGHWSLRYASDGAVPLLSRPAQDLVRDFNLFVACFDLAEIEQILAEFTHQAARGASRIEREIRLAQDGPWVEFRVAIEQERDVWRFDGILVDITEKKVNEQRVQTAAERIQELAIHNIQLKEKERKHLAREIHDELGQLLTVLKMDLRLATLKVPDNCQSLREDLERALTVVSETVAASRRVISHLRPPALDLGLDAGIEWLAEDFRRCSQVACRVNMPPQPLELGEAVSVHLFRILQESLTNVLKHAQANQVTLTLELDEEWLYLDIEDDGVGFDPSLSTRQFGLLGVRERLHLLNGDLFVVSCPGQGTRLRVTVPLESHA